MTSKRCETVYNGEGTLNEPGGICAHPTEDWVYIADTNNHSIKCLDLTTANITQVGESFMYQPQDGEYQ